ncbi:DUF262 domain-containing protein [Alloalcanivorax xenomutans]|uniref:DUF262 domain-containing protein n=1 Tax=Alloalcanivorax xenomutans TaxID=1094342 RepID=UPI0024E250E6|nr:DUF262 domain-containing HNH endonuclease family protein [Alloalcanivorax xenomutans]
MQIKELFDAEAQSILDVFNDAGGNVGLIIPSYQRPYSWDRSHIRRLIDDVNEGLDGLGIAEEKDSLTFVGTVILSKVKHIPEFRNVALSVVDGQQRLTTILLLCSVLYSKIADLIEEIRGLSKVGPEADDFVNREAESVKDRLLACLLGQFQRFANTPNDFFPRIIRDSEDKWSSEPSQREYRSPVSRYIFDFGYAAFKGRGINLKNVIDKMKGGEDERKFSSNLAVIIEEIDRLFLEENNENSKYIANGKIKSVLYPAFPHSAKEMAKAIKSCPEFSRLIALCSYSKYLLESVAVTRVIANEEKFAFDIFEALNTTGEPLTALETFKPIVVRFEDESNRRKWVGSESSDIFKDIEQHLNEYTRSEERQKQAKDIVSHLALYVEGKKIGLSLSEQRRYLREAFAGLGSESSKREFVKSIRQLIEFRKSFWVKNELEVQLPGDVDRTETLACLDFIRETKTTISIPLLTRVYVDSAACGNFIGFHRVAKGVAAFIALWRAFYGSTNRIDDAFREMMGASDKRKLPMSGKRRKKDEITAAPLDPDQVIHSLKVLLESQGISSKDVWVKNASKQALYTKSKSLCKFVFLASMHHYQYSKEEKKMIKIRPDKKYAQITLESWRDPVNYTIEHIAPQSNKDGNWSSDIYFEPWIVHSIGNLALLPEKENVAAANYPWDKKRIFYKAFSSSTEDTLEQNIEKAKKEGFNFKKSTEGLLKEGARVSSLEPILDIGNWSVDVIGKRSEEILDRAWGNIAPWVDL